VNRRQRRAEQAKQRRMVPLVAPVAPHCSHPPKGLALGCPICGRFEVRGHLLEANDGELLMCCACGEVLLTYRPHAPASFIEWLQAEVARLDAGGEPPEPCQGGREAYAAYVRERLAELLAMRASPDVIEQQFSDLAAMRARGAPAGIQGTSEPAGAAPPEGG
jgi:hypothetical protein